MNRTELVAAVAASTGQTKGRTDATIHAVMDIICGKLSQGEEVSLVGFGKFKTVGVKPRTGRNPSNGEIIQIPARIKPVFKPGLVLINAVNSNELY